MEKRPFAFSISDLLAMMLGLAIVLSSPLDIFHTWHYQTSFLPVHKLLWIIHPSLALNYQELNAVYGMLAFLFAFSMSQAWSNRRLASAAECIVILEFFCLFQSPLIPKYRTLNLLQNTFASVADWFSIEVFVALVSVSLLCVAFLAHDIFKKWKSSSPFETVTKIALVFFILVRTLFSITWIEGYGDFSHVYTGLGYWIEGQICYIVFAFPHAFLFTSLYLLMFKDVCFSRAKRRTWIEWLSILITTGMLLGFLARAYRVHVENWFHYVTKPALWYLDIVVAIIYHAALIVVCYRMNEWIRKRYLVDLEPSVLPDSLELR